MLPIEFPHSLATYFHLSHYYCNGNAHKCPSNLVAPRIYRIEDIKTIMDSECSAQIISSS